MTVIALPSFSGKGVASANWNLIRNVAAAESPLGATVQRLVRSGDRWAADLQFPEYLGDNAGVLVAWLEQASRGDRWFYLSPPQNSVRGSWGPVDLVSNGRFLTDTTGWTASGSTLSVNTRRIKIKNTGAANGQARQNVTLEAGAPHVLLFDAGRGNVTAAQATITRQSDNVAEADTGNLVAPVRGVLLVAPTVAAMTVRLKVDTTVSGDSVFYGRGSLTRCLQVNGAAQTGVRLNVSGGPGSVNAALKAGEFVSVLVGTLYQLLRLTEDFDSDGSGTGTLVFEPALRGSPATLAPVIVRNPFARFMLPQHNSQHAIRAPLLHGIAVSAVEDVTP